jgi:hypothetical protein
MDTIDNFVLFADFCTASKKTDIFYHEYIGER